MPLEYRAEGDRLVWVRNPFSGTITYFTNVHLKRNGFVSRAEPGSRDVAAAATEAAGQLAQQVPIGPQECPFCPGNESQSADEVYRLTEHDVFGSGKRDGWLIRAVRNLVPRVPESCTGGKNESYVVVEDPRHFRARSEKGCELLHSAHLAEEQFAAVLEVDREVARRAYRNPAVRHVLIRKNQGRESGASQPHIHSQVIGNDRVFPAVCWEREVTTREPAIWHEIIEFARHWGFVLREESGTVLYFCPFGTFPRSYEVVSMESWRSLVDVDLWNWDRFVRFLHRGLKVLGERPLDYEIHDGPGVPLHAHIHSRHYPYAEIGGTLNLPTTLLSMGEILNPPDEIA